MVHLGGGGAGHLVGSALRGLGLGGWAWRVEGDGERESLPWAALLPGGLWLVSLLVLLLLFLVQSLGLTPRLFWAEDSLAIGEAYVRSRAFEQGTPDLLLQTRNIPLKPDQPDPHSDQA